MQRRPLLVAPATLVLAGAVHGQCELLKLQPPDANFADHVGASVALWDDKLVVGASGSDRAYVYRFDGVSWQLEETFTGVAGYSVDVHRDRIVSTSGAGIHVWDFDGAAWTQVADLDADMNPYQADTALWGDVAAVGEYGSEPVVVYRRGAGEWAEEQQISPPEGPSSGFGVALDLHTDTLLVGDSSANAAYVYRWDGLSWGIEAKLEPPDLLFGTGAGRDVALDGDVAVLGAALGSGSFDLPGTAHVFRHTGGGTWVHEAQLLASDGGDHDYFGISVDVFGDTVVVGAEGEWDSPHPDGIAYLFEYDGSAWRETASLESEGSNDLGHSVALGPRRVAAGDWGYSQPSSTIGAAFVFEKPLYSDVSALSLSAGGVQPFDVTAGACYAGDYYWIWGSLSGTDPGLDLGGLHLPLNPDAYTLFSIANTNTPPFAGSFAQVDVFGKGAASFTVPAGSNPALAGLVLHHAFLVADSFTGELYYGSNALRLALHP